MIEIGKRPLVLALAATAPFLASAALAQTHAPVPGQPADPPPSQASQTPAPEAASRLDGLLAELASPETEDWRRVEAEILRVWSQSGSEAMDLLLRRGRDAIEAEDYVVAVEHLTALTDHAPDFAEGWNARATAFFMMGEYTLSMADIEQVLRLNPRHFGALAGLAVMFEELGDTRLALQAHQAAQVLNPHRPEVERAIERLERSLGGAEL
jgi:tetratricopeptide (TPR) repeat protein